MNIITKRALSFFIVIFGLLTCWHSYADGTDIIVPKGSTSGTISTPPAAGVGEYPASGAGTFSNAKGSFQVQTYRNGDGSIEEIQFYFSINDGTVGLGEAGDQIQVRFDLDHEHTNSAIDRGFRVLRSLELGATNNVRLTDINLFADPSDLGGGDLPAAQWSLEPDLGGTWTAEVKLTASNLGLNYIPSILGMHIFVNDSADTDGTYPTTVNRATIASWSNFKTRNNLEYALLLDRSYSMEDSIDGTIENRERWNAAKIASDIFVQLYYVVRSAEDGGSTPYFDDKIGLATFTNTSYGIDDDLSAIVKPLSSLNNITVDGYVDAAPDPDVPLGGTPIKYGLNTAFSMFSNNDAERVILLLSDGFHNVPSFTYADTAYNYSGLSQSDFQVNTVALSDDTDLDDNVGTDLLDDIKDDFSGFGNAYIDASSRSSLVDAFVENLFGHLYLNKTDIDGSGDFSVNANEPRIIVMLVWHSDSGSDRGFRLRRPDTTLIDTGDPSYHHFRNTTLGYEVAYYVVETPATGTWRTVETASLNAEIADNNLAIFDPTVYAFFTATQSGKDFVLKAVLKENGVPMTEPDSVVNVTISKPDEGLGTYASTAQRDCSSAEPVLPSIGSIQEVLGAYQGQYKYVVSRNPAGTTTAPAASGQENALESAPLHIQYVHEIFELCGKRGLDRTNGITLKLYDDASNGDQTAGDGIFTLKYTDTAVEGTYKFNFKASGTSPMGSDYSRLKKLSAHNKVEPGSLGSVFDFRDIQVIDGLVYREYYFIPKSDAGEYLGPGHLSSIEFLIEGAEMVGEIQDYQNGIYSQIVTYPKRGNEPTVTAVVNGIPIAKSEGGTAEPTWPWYYWLLMVLVIIILLILLLRRP